MLSRKYRRKHVKDKRWKARRRKTRIWSRRDGDSVVYMHRNRRNGKIYIGYTTRACYERWTYGQYKSKGNNNYFYNALIKEKELYEEAGIQSNDRFLGFESRILVDGLNEKDAPEVEKVTIAFFKNKGVELYNRTNGGDSPPILRGKDNPMYGKHHSEEARKKISEAMKNPSEETRRKMSKNHADFSGEKHPMYGRTHSEESKKKMSEALKGRTLSEETRKKISEAMKGEKNPNNRPEVRAAKSEFLKNNPELNPNPPKPVEAINPNTGLRAHYFASTRSAEQFGFDHGAIGKCCNRKQKTHKGYIWRYVDEKNNQQE